MFSICLRHIVMTLTFVVTVFAASAHAGTDYEFPAVSQSQFPINTTGYPCPSDPPQPSNPSTPGDTSDISPSGQKALRFIANREGIARGHLQVIDEFRRDAPLLERELQAVTVANTRATGQIYKVLVDRQTGQVEDQEAIDQAQRSVHAAKYGKLAPDLYDRLQQLQRDDAVTVTIFVAPLPGNSLTNSAS